MDLFEIATSPVPYTWDEMDDSYGAGTFRVGEQSYYFSATLFEADDELPERWDIEFGLMRHAGPAEFGNTGTGKEFTVFATVIRMAQEFFSTHPTSCIIASAADSSRQSLYKRLFARMLPTWTVQQHGTVLVAMQPKKRGRK